MACAYLTRLKSNADIAACCDCIDGVWPEVPDGVSKAVARRERDLDVLPGAHAGVCVLSRACHPEPAGSCHQGARMQMHLRMQAAVLTTSGIAMPLARALKGISQPGRHQYKVQHCKPSLSPSTLLTLPCTCLFAFRCMQVIHT